MTRAKDISKIVTDANLSGTLNVTGETTLATHLNMGDNDIIKLGASDDLQIYHTGSASVIKDGGTGDLYIAGSTNVKITNGDINEDMAVFTHNGAVTLNYDNSPKFATTSTGIDVTGVITTDGMTTSADINFGDNDKAIFGAGGDLQIYHDGTHSYIKDTGTGNLRFGCNVIQILNEDANETILDANQNGGVNLRYDNSVKISTTSTGIDVTGVITTDGMTTSADINFGDNDKALFGASDDLEIYSDGTTSHIRESGSGGFLIDGANIQFRDAGGGFANFANFSSNGAVSLYWDGNLRFATTSVGIQVDGPNPEVRINDNNETGSTNLKFHDSVRETAKISVASGTSANLQVNMLGTPAFKIDSNNDISFYEDTGTTPKLFWDSSQEQLFLNGTIDNSTRPQIALDGGSGGSGRSAGISGLASGTNATSLLFFTNADTDIPRARMRIDSAGNLLVGTTSTGNAGGISIMPNASNGSGIIIFDRSNTTLTSTALNFENNNSAVGSVAFNNSSTFYNTSSDHRLKENVTADWDATTRLKQLNPVRFNFIADADTTVDGFLAHEVQSVVPEAITGTHNEVDADGNPVYQGIDQSKLVPLLVKTIQELEARIVALETA